jgi:hypothetical protein
MNIKPNQRAKREILSAKRTLGVGATTEQIMELTGYSKALVRAVIKNSSETIRRPKTEPMPNEQKYAPTFVREIQANTELLAIRVGAIRDFEEWLLLAPTGVPLLRLLGKDDLLQFAKPMRESPKILQGVTTSQLEERRKRRLKKRKRKGET